MYTIEEDAGPLAGWVANDTAPKFLQSVAGIAYADSGKREDDHEHEEDLFEEFWEEAHEILANFSLLLVGLHIAGVLFSSYAGTEIEVDGQELLIMTEADILAVMN